MEPAIDVAERNHYQHLEHWTKLGMETSVEQRPLATGRGNGNTPQRGSPMMIK